MKRICSIALVLGILIQPTSSKAEFFMAGMGAVHAAQLPRVIGKILPRPKV